MFSPGHLWTCYVYSFWTEQFGKISLHNRRICEAEREMPYTTAKKETQKYEIQNPESGIRNPELLKLKDRKTSLQQCVMNKYQFSIFPAEKLLLTLIEYWAICLMIGHPPFRGIDWSVRAVRLFLRARAVINFLMRAASTLEITNGEQQALLLYLTHQFLDGVL